MASPSPPACSPIMSPESDFDPHDVKTEMMFDDSLEDQLYDEDSGSSGSLDSLGNGDYPGSPSSSSAGSPITITTTIGSGPNKRKQVMTLPLPPGTLPPRKRAKTKDEKEQRRIERIMRNRQAAHASREKKRKHVEELEKKCVSLSSENEKLNLQMHQAKKAQAQMLDQQYLLVAKLQRITSALTAAKASGCDLSALDLPSLDEEVVVASCGNGNTLGTRSTLLETQREPPSHPAEISLASPDSLAGSTTPKDLVSSPSFASPQSLVLNTFTAPSLSSSAANSPLIKTEDFSDSDSYSLMISSDNRSHHPAVMMCQHITV